VVGASPSLIHADRDLDGDDRPEVVVADENLCSSDGNCHWNLFAVSGDPPCARYLGTVAAEALEAPGSRGEDGFLDLRGWWALTGGGRMLLQEYHFSHGGYRLTDALVCRRDEDRLLCGSDPATPAAADL
jgi:hypothetical protein